MVGVERSRACNRLEEECEIGMFWNEVVEVFFDVVSGRWYWVGGLGRGLFMMVFTGWLVYFDEEERRVCKLCMVRCIVIVR